MVLNTKLITEPEIIFFRPVTTLRLVFGKYIVTSFYVIHPRVNWKFFQHYVSESPKEEMIMKCRISVLSFNF